MPRSSPQRFVGFSPGGSGRWSWWLLLAALTALALYAAVFRVKGAVAATPGKLLPARANITRTAGKPRRERSAIAELGDDRMARLGHNLREAVHHAPARMAAVYVEDIETGASAGANADRPFVAASLIKVPVMATTYAVWQDRPERKTPTARWWMEQMITVSDNACTDRLIDLVGGPEVVTRFCEQRGWKELKVRHAILNHRGRHGTNTCTAREMVDLLVALDQRKLVSETADEEMWRVLLRQKKRHRIPEGIPHRPDVQIGNKTGTLGNALHDAGIVHTPNGRYALCILLSGQKSDASGEKFCRAVSRLVYHSLGGEELPVTEVARR